MEHTKLIELAGKEYESLIKNLVNISESNSYLVNETLNLLSDNNPMYDIISDVNKVALLNMIRTYTDLFFLGEDDYSSVINYAKFSIYKVNTPHGERYASKNEINDGIRQLIAYDTYPIGEDKYKLLCLLQWSLTGKTYYFREAGYSLDYDSNGNVVTTVYEMITKCALQLKALFEWFKDDESFSKALSILRKMKKKGGFKYAEKVSDEIKEDISCKQLLYSVDKIFTRNSSNKEYRKALALVIKSKKTKLKPEEISFLRNAYYEYARDKNSFEDSLVDELDEEKQKLKDECDALKKASEQHQIKKEHFVFRIISTLERINYCRCSPKQYAIITSALKEVEDTKKRNEEEDKQNRINIEQSKNQCVSPVISDLNDISDILGQGLLGS